MKTLIHLTTDDAQDVEFALAYGRSLRRNDVGATLLCHRDGAPIGVRTSEWADRLSAAMATSVDVVVSEGCLRARDYPVDVVEGARVTTKGSVEVTRLQHDGYALLKVP